MMFTAGYATMGRYRGVPIRWHWSLVLSLVLFGGGFGVGDSDVSPLRWVFILALILLHEAGHHAMVRHYRLKPIGVDIQGLGAETRWVGDATPRQEIAIAWAGVFAQLVAMAVVIVGFGIYETFGGVLTAGWMVDVEYVYRDVNAVLILVNLIPLPTFDGDVAWKIFALWRGDLHARRVIVIQVAGDEPIPVDPDRVRAEVDAELEAITQAHNAKAEAQSPK